MVAHDELRERIAEIVYDEYRVGRMPDYQPMWHTLEDKPAAMLRAADRILALFGEPVAWAPMAMEYHEDGPDTPAGLLYGPVISPLVAFRDRAQCEHEYPDCPAVPLYALTSGEETT